MSALGQETPIEAGSAQRQHAERFKDGFSKPYTERDIIELMVRAPAVPEWFEPDMSGVEKPQGYQGQWDSPIGKTCRYIDLEYIEEANKRKTLQWPRAYALMVLEAK